MESIKKCPNCGNWSAWNHNIDDRCEHCNELLDKVRLEAKEKRKEREEQQTFDVTLIKIYPNDSIFIKTLKYLVRAGQITFVAIVSFFIWLIAAIAS